jgi:hypothetical protein
MLYFQLGLVDRFHKPVQKPAQFSNWFIGTGSIVETVYWNRFRFRTGFIKETVLEPVFPKIL